MATYKNAKMTSTSDKVGVQLNVCQIAWFDKNQSYAIANAPSRTSSLIFSGADLNYFGRCLYAESSGSQSLPDINARKAEKEALVNVFYFRLNRKGYPSNRYVATSFTMVCNAPNQFQSIQPTPSPKLLDSAPAEVSHLSQMECADLQECIDAITTFLTTGPNLKYMYDNFRAGYSGTRGTKIGGSRFWLSAVGKELVDAIHKLLLQCLIVLLLQLVCGKESIAQISTVELDMGSIRIDQKSGDFLSFALKDGKTVRVEDRSGSYWPPVYIDSRGFIYVGDKVLDSHSGLKIRDDNDPDLVIVGSRFAVRGDSSAKTLTLFGKSGICKIDLTSLQSGLAEAEGKDVLRGRVRFAESANALAVLTAVFDERGVLKYRASMVDPQTCRVISSVDLGNPDLLVELGWSPDGGFWITGAQEPTLLRSNDGKVWTSVNLPQRFSELMSVFISDRNEIWLAAQDGDDTAADSPDLMHSADDGKTWHALTWDSPLLKRVPKYWLEGQVRARGRVVK